MTKKVLTDKLSEPLNGATTARVEVNAADSNLTIDRLTGSEQLLASGMLQYYENQGLPTRVLDSSNGQAVLALRGSSARQPWLHLPWAACNGATKWQIHLNPTVPSDITAHCDGGNVRLDLAGMVVTRLSADTGGGNMDVVLPDNAANLNVTAGSGAGNVSVGIGSGLTGSSLVTVDSGAGNVVVSISSNLAARIRATKGLGKAIVDSRFIKISKDTYQSADFDSAANKVEIALKSGAGNVIVRAR